MSHLFYHDERFSLGRKDTLIDNEASSSSIHKKVGTTMQIIYANIKRCSLQDVSVHLSYVWKEFNSIIIQYNYLYALSLIWKKKIALLAFIKYFMIFVEYCCVVFLSWKVKHCWNFVIVNLSLIFLIRSKFWIWYQTD